MVIRITHLLDSNRPIQAMKEARAIKPGFGLRDAKDLVDAVRGLNGPPVPQVVVVPDETQIDKLEWLGVEVVEPLPLPLPLSPSVPRDLCLDFLLDVLANASAGDAATLRTKASYLAFLEAVR